MNTQQLECFVRVADKLNFTKAAEELYISTPAVTHHIKNLEEELNTTLFIRTSKMVKLTETGALFYNEAKDILQKIDFAEKKIQKLTDQKLPIIRIGCSSQTELSRFEKPLKKIKELFPNIHPQFTVLDYFLLKTLFDNKQLDILIGTKEMLREAHEYIFKKTEMVECFAVVSENSELSKEKSINLELLYEHPLITLNPRFIPAQYDNKIHDFIMLHSRNNLHFLCENDQSAILLAKCNYGIAILPEIYIPSNKEGIITLPIAEAKSAVEYGIAYHKNVKEKHIKHFINCFKNK